MSRQDDTVLVSPAYMFIPLSSFQVRPLFSKEKEVAAPNVLVYGLCQLNVYLILKFPYSTL